MTVYATNNHVALCLASWTKTWIQLGGGGRGGGGGGGGGRGEEN